MYKGWIYGIFPKRSNIWFNTSYPNTYYLTWHHPLSTYGILFTFHVLYIDFSTAIYFISVYMTKFSSIYKVKSFKCLSLIVYSLSYCVFQHSVHTYREKRRTGSERTIFINLLMIPTICDRMSCDKRRFLSYHFSYLVKFFQALKTFLSIHFVQVFRGIFFVCFGEPKRMQVYFEWERRFHGKFFS